MLNIRTATMLILSGTLILLLGLACWRLGLDPPLHRWLRLSASAQVDRDVIALSALGGLVVMGPLALLAAAWLVSRRRRGDAVWLVATIGSGRLAVEALKLAVARPRPPVLDRLEIVTSWSFPSSHSAGTMMTALALAALFGGGGSAYAVALLAAAIIGWSRVALAVHWPGDVLAGWGLGMVWIGIASRLRGRSRARLNPPPPAPQGDRGTGPGW